LSSLTSDFDVETGDVVDAVAVAVVAGDAADMTMTAVVVVVDQWGSG
jgi:hypothetical protein